MELRGMMKVVAPIDHVALSMTAEQIALDAKLHLILSSVLKGPAMDKWVNAPDGHGLEVYRKFARAPANLPKSAGHHRQRLLKLLNPDAEVLCGDYEARKDKWEAQLREYERVTKSTVPDDLKCGVLQHALAP